MVFNLFTYEIDNNCFEFLCQSLVDTNMPLLILKMLNAWFPPVRNNQEAPNAWLTHSDPPSLTLHPLSKGSTRNRDTTFKLLDILYKMCKGSFRRIQILLQWKSSFVLKRILKTPIIIKPLKLLKLQIPYFGKKWKTKNSMKIVSMIYLHLRPKLIESYLCDEMQEVFVRKYVI